MNKIVGGLFLFIVGTVLSLVTPEYEKGLIMFFWLFQLASAYAVILSIIQAIKDGKTEQHGIITYGIVRKRPPIVPGVEYGSDDPPAIEVINPVTKELEMFIEDVGNERYKYEVNTFVLCRYHKKDINVEAIISQDELPEEAKKLLRIKSALEEYEEEY